VEPGNEKTVSQVEPGNEKTVLDSEIRQLFESLTVVSGKLQMPAVPSMIDEIMSRIEGVLCALRQHLSPAEIDSWRQIIADKLPEWFADSPNNSLIVNYELLKPELGLPGGVKVSFSKGVSSIETHYQDWSQTREGPLFGSQGDAKVMAIASELGDPANTPILDVGAGNGRNSLALARKGYPVDAVELTQVLVEQLLAAKTAEKLEIGVIQADILDPLLKVPTSFYKLAILAEVIASHFHHVHQVRELMIRMSQVLQPGGLLLFNAFLAVDGYEPSVRVREMSQIYWSCIFTRAELHLAMEGLPWEILSDESVFEYERLHLPAEAWPPTPWFVNWCTGRNLFPIEETPPIELRWVLCRRI